MPSKKAKRSAKPVKNLAPIHINLPANAADAIKNIAQQQQDDMFAGMLNMVGSVNLPGMGDFATAIICQDLLRREEHIISAEWYESRGVNSIESSSEAIDRYVVARAKAEKQLGKEKLEAQLAQARVEHNECARTNLDNSNGMLYCYVLPDFNPDGTHGSVGPKDIPWNQK